MTDISKSRKDEVLAKIDKALQHVFDIAAGRQRWTMCIPARPDEDSDCLLADALRGAQELIQSEIAATEAAGTGNAQPASTEPDGSGRPLAASNDKTDEELRQMWRASGGFFYGPHVEHGAMPEEKLLPFLRSLTRSAEVPTLPWEDENDPCTRGLYRLAQECGWSSIHSRPPSEFIRDKLVPSATAPITDNDERWRFLEHGCQWVSWIAHGKEQVSFDPRKVDGMGGLVAMRTLIDEQTEEHIAFLRAEVERFKGTLK